MKKLILVAALGSMLTACGGKTSDPTEKYSGLKNDVPTAKRNTVEQQFNQCGVAIDTDPTLRIVEGQTGTHKVLLRGLRAPSRDSISVVRVTNDNVSKGSVRLTRVRSTADGSEYALSYTAPRGSAATKGDFNVVLSPSSILKAGLSCPTAVGIVVVKDDSVPVVAEIRDPRPAKSGSIGDQTVTVQVQAPNANANNLQLQLNYDRTASSPEKLVYDMSQALTRVSDAVPAGSGKFRFTVKIDGEILQKLVDRQAKARPSERSFLMLASISVYNSDTHTASVAQNIVLEVSRDLTPAEIERDRATSERNAAARQKEADAKAARDAAEKAARDAAATAAAVTAAAGTPAPAAAPKGKGKGTPAPAPAATAAPTPAPSATPAPAAKPAPAATPTPAAKGKGTPAPAATPAPTPTPSPTPAATPAAGSKATNQPAAPAAGAKK